MSVAVLTRPRQRFAEAFHVVTSGVGADSDVVVDLMRRANTEIGSAAQNWEPQIAAAIAAIADECSAPNWDGEDALPVSPETLNRAERVATLFYCYVPKTTPAPDLIPEGDGEVSLNWSRDPDHVFSVSIGSHENLNYAGRLGGGVEPHDVARFNLQDPSPIEQMASYLSQLYR